MNPTRRTGLGLFLLCLGGVTLVTSAGTASAQNADATAARSDASTLPSFEVATIKPMDPNAGVRLGSTPVPAAGSSWVLPR
jgi:hypothetical protein